MAELFARLQSLPPPPLEYTSRRRIVKLELRHAIVEFQEPMDGGKAMQTTRRTVPLCFSNAGKWLSITTFETQDARGFADWSHAIEYKSNVLWSTGTTELGKHWLCIEKYSCVQYPWSPNGSSGYHGFNGNIANLIVVDGAEKDGKKDDAKSNSVGPLWTTDHNAYTWILKDAIKLHQNAAAVTFIKRMANKTTWMITSNNRLEIHGPGANIQVFPLPESASSIVDANNGNVYYKSGQTVQINGAKTLANEKAPVARDTGILHCSSDDKQSAWSSIYMDSDPFLGWAMDKAVSSVADNLENVQMRYLKSHCGYTFGDTVMLGHDQGLVTVWKAHARCRPNATQIAALFTDRPGAPQVEIKSTWVPPPRTLAFDDADDAPQPAAAAASPAQPAALPIASAATARPVAVSVSQTASHPPVAALPVTQPPLSQEPRHEQQVLAHLSQLQMQMQEVLKSANVAAGAATAAAHNSAAALEVGHVAIQALPELTAVAVRTLPST
jgi:hypothetical protein